MSKTILVSGATGLVGRTLCRTLEQEGHQVRRLSRSSGNCRWDPLSGALEPRALEGVNTVIHLAGESIAQRWTASAKERILLSRVKSTELLVREILKQPVPPDFICASGVGVYGYNVYGRWVSNGRRQRWRKHWRSA